MRHAETLKLAGRYEEAAEIYEEMDMYKKAGETRKKDRVRYQIVTNIQIAPDGGIRIQCPYCGSSERVESKSSEVSCKHCGKTYFIPKKILDMI